MPDKPNIFIFCNSCSEEWHEAVALSEDGEFLAGHVCSDHGWIPHDMGIGSDWKHERYDAHYPQGWELVYLEQSRVRTDPRTIAAYAAHLAKAAVEAGQ